MPGTSQGTPCPEQQTSFSTTSGEEPLRPEEISIVSPRFDAEDIEFSAVISRAEENIQRVEKMNQESDQRGHTWSIPVPPSMQSRTPIWSGRMQWQRQVRELLNEEKGRNVCRRHHADPERVFAVAVTMASFADLRTGRRVTASRDVLADRAGVSVTVLKRARRVLSDLGLAREMIRGRFLRTLEQWAAEAHHGRRQVKGTSVWSLISPRAAVRSPCDAGRPESSARSCRAALSSTDASSPPRYPQTSDGGPQSVALSSGSCTSVKKYKTTRASARRNRNSPKGRPQPRPIGLQKAAAALVAATPCLEAAGHIGSVCDALRDHYVDTERWSGRDIATALNEDTRRRGWIWPSRGSLKHPVRYLRWRLAAIDWSLPSPTERAEAAKHLRDAERRTTARVLAHRNAQTASAGTRQSAMTQIRELLQGKRSKVSGS